jgi:peptide-methionine (R)-S-oxide reductase
MDPKVAARLTPQQYEVCFLKGTEPPGSGKYYRHDKPGVYHCVACGQPLFSSSTKYDSNTGWPAFWDTAHPEAVTATPDTSHGMHRTEISCGNCGSHLGHVFTDGPSDKTGLRYCINSLSLDFLPQKTV